MNPHLDHLCAQLTADDLRDLLKGLDRAVLQDALRYREIRDHYDGEFRFGDTFRKGTDLDRAVDEMIQRRQHEQSQDTLRQAMAAVERVGHLPGQGGPGYSSGGFQPLPDPKIREGGILKRQERSVKEPKHQYPEASEDYSGL
jgi:hypothetical protein